MADLFEDDSDSEINIEFNNDYAKKHDTWGQKEVLQTLKDRYGDEDQNDSSSSEDEDEDAKELTEQVEKDFYKTLSYLKKKDPSIYDKDVRFFKAVDNTSDSAEAIKSKRKKSEKPIFLRDHERKLIVERGGKLSDDEDEHNHPGCSNAHRSMSPTLVEEQEAIKAGFKSVLQDSDGEDNAWGGLFEPRKKTHKELEKDDEGYLDWLKGQQGEIKDKKVEKELKHLHDFWNDPKLDSNEQFLKDYILNRKFLDADDKNRVPTYDEIVHDSDEGLSEDEATVAKQEEFEHKFNFRFEEPDQDFIKRYPRIMENSLRRKDTRRKEKRNEVKERKVAQKERMKDELKQLKALKRKEIMQRIEKLKEITGNADVGFQGKDLEGDFDPALHDQFMSQLFTEDFYGKEENDEKPNFPELDEELELEQWDECNDPGAYQDNGYSEPHCDDPDFNMDCDYNPTARFQEELIESTQNKKKGRKSKLAQALTKKKPVFDPSNRTFEEYVDEYYGMDFEDVVGGLPCRFKYRKVMPNSFGLTIEEILKADDKELNKWCSLKKAVQHRPEYLEKKDYNTYQRKASNEAFKRKILPSLYKEPEEQLDEEPKKEKKKRKKKSMQTQNDTQDNADVVVARKSNKKSNCSTKNIVVKDNSLNTEESLKQSTNTKGSKKRKITDAVVGSEVLCPDDSKTAKKRKVMEFGDRVDKPAVLKNEIKPVLQKRKKKKKKSSKIKKGAVGAQENDAVKKISEEVNGTISRRKKKNKKLVIKKMNTSTSAEVKVPLTNTEMLISKKTKKKRSQGLSNKKNIHQDQSDSTNFTDGRLKAYGLHPKKFKNYLKYGKTDN